MNVSPAMPERISILAGYPNRLAGLIFFADFS